MIKIPRLAVAFVEIKGITGKFKASMAQAQRVTNKFGSSATKSIRRATLGLAAMGVAAGVAAVAIGVKLAQALIRVGRATIQTAVKYDKLKIGLIAIVGSAEEAEKQLRRLRVLALAPGLGFEQAIQGSTALQAAGLSAALAERSMAAFGNALAIVGKGAQDLSRVNLQLSQIAAKAGGFGRDLLVIREAVPSIGPILTKAFDGEPLENMTVAGKELINVMVAGLEGLGQAGESVGNNLVNLGVSFDLLKNEIGKTMLSITSDTVKGLTGIIDKLTIVIGAYKNYRIEAAKVFRELALIGVRLTAKMVLGMSGIVIEAAKIMWVPLKFSVIRTMKDIGDEMEIGMIRALGAIRKLFGGDAEIARLQEATVKTSRFVWESWFKTIRNADFDKAINEGLLNIEGDIKRTFDAMMAAFGDANTVLDTFVKRLPKEVAAAADEAVRALKAIDPKELAFLTLPQEDPAKAAARLKESRQRIIKFRDDIGKDMNERQKRQLANFREFLDAQWEAQERMRERFENAASGMRNAFSDFISESLSDIENLSDAWSSFVRNFKNAFLRAVGDMLADKAVLALGDALFGPSQRGGGGKGGGGGGFGAFLQGISPLIAALNPVAGGIITAAGAIGSFLEQPGGNNNQGNRSITANFFETDFANMDRNRLQKTVSQVIGPALSEERADGRA